MHKASVLQTIYLVATCLNMDWHRMKCILHSLTGQDISKMQKPITSRWWTVIKALNFVTAERQLILDVAE